MTKNRGKAAKAVYPGFSALIAWIVMVFLAVFLAVIVSYLQLLFTSTIPVPAGLPLPVLEFSHPGMFSLLLQVSELHLTNLAIDLAFWYLVSVLSIHGYRRLRLNQ